MLRRDYSVAFKQGQQSLVLDQNYSVPEVYSQKSRHKARYQKGRKFIAPKPPYSTGLL